jgi:uncharacterized protein
MDSCFVDTSWWKALVDEKDEFHSRTEKWKGKDIRLVTTNYIIDEMFTLVRVKCGLEKCHKLSEILEATSTILSIERVRAQDERKAWEWFWKDWSKLSFTDCTSFVVMERLGLKDVLTFDEHFLQAGFNIC